MNFHSFALPSIAFQAIFLHSLHPNWNLYVFFFAQESERMLRKKNTEVISRQCEQLKALAYNLWWTWNPEAQEIFRELSPLVWEQSNHNAVAVIKSVSPEEILFRLHDDDFLRQVTRVLKEFDSYMKQPRTWGAVRASKLKRPVAYFSAEFGLHESLPIYSGGLGVLSGDHAKSASDLGFPFVALSLFYRHGYFQQRLTPDGWQQEELPTNDPERLPVTLVQNQQGGRLLNSVEIGQSTVYFQTWQVDVGRIRLLLLDTNIPENDQRFQVLTNQVYGGDIQTRIGQETLLGIGGVRLLRSLGIDPAVFHMNEGHSAFLTFELLREELAAGKSKAEAEKSVRQKCIFTTHTPVPAGHDRFAPDLMQQTFEKYWSGFPVSPGDLLAYGRIHPEHHDEPFTMTILALKMSRGANGVSELHGRVSREMWKDLYPGKAVEKIPIGHITNGVHTPSWASSRAHQFWNRRLGYDWTRKLMDKDYWEKLENNGIASDEELWGLRFVLRRELVEFVHRRLQQQSGPHHSPLSPDALTIGFARRFATYKRAPLIFRNLDMILPLFKNPERPLQMVFAGKAHPRDAEGKKYIQRIIEISRLPELAGKVIFIENYDMNVARYLVAGADVWLNTPRRPLEASGTSGMKVLIHGGLNLSIMDGWWREGYNGRNGWSIGDDSNDTDMEQQDDKDFQALINVLANEVVPEFYERDELGMPRKWIKRIRNSMRTLLSTYNTERMVAEYVKKYYLAAS